MHYQEIPSMIYFLIKDYASYLEFDLEFNAHSNHKKYSSQIKWATELETTLFHLAIDWAALWSFLLPNHHRARFQGIRRLLKNKNNQESKKRSPPRAIKGKCWRCSWTHQQNAWLGFCVLECNHFNVFPARPQQGDSGALLLDEACKFKARPIYIDKWSKSMCQLDVSPVWCASSS